MAGRANRVGLWRIGHSLGDTLRKLAGARKKTDPLDSTVSADL